MLQQPDRNIVRNPLSSFRTSKGEKNKMDTMLALFDMANNGVALDSVVGRAPSSQFGQNLVVAIRAILGPILLLVMGVVMIRYIWAKQMSQMWTTLIISVVVAAVFYVPNVIETIGVGIANLIDGAW